MKKTIGLSRKHIFVFLTMTLILTLVVSGCFSEKTSQTKVSKTVTIRITGSSTCLPLMHILTNAYNKKYPNVKFLYLPAAHSAAGIQGAANGTLDIGAVSRDLNPEEAALGLEYIVLSNDGLVIATHKDTNIKNITTDQLKDVYGGSIATWIDLGAGDASIVVLDRAEDESAKVVMRKYVFGDLAITPSASVMFLETDLIKALETTPNSIGYLSYGAAITDKLPINILALDGVEPSVSNIHKGAYRVVRPLGVVLKKKPSPATSAFIEWASGSQGAKVMEDKGYASVK